MRRPLVQRWRDFWAGVHARRHDKAIHRRYRPWSCDECGPCMMRRWAWCEDPSPGTR